MKDLGVVVCNLEADADEAVIAALMAEPGRVYATHTAFDFYGYVWFEADQFHEEVWRYRSPVKVVSAGEFAELIKRVSEEFGTE